MQNLSHQSIFPTPVNISITQTNTVLKIDNEEIIIFRNNINSTKKRKLSNLQQEIKSNDYELTTSDTFKKLKNVITNYFNKQIELKNLIKKQKRKLIFAKILCSISYILIIGLFIKWFKVNKTNNTKQYTNLTKDLENCHVNLNIEFDSITKDKYGLLLANWNILISCNYIWDVTSEGINNQKITRSFGDISVNRKKVYFDTKKIDFIKSDYNFFHLQNANGTDLYIHPTFFIIMESNKIDIIELDKLNINLHGVRYSEEEKIPNDTKIVDHTWKKVNKNGIPDKRFKDNYQIPICLYGEMNLINEAIGLNECYMFSDFDKVQRFVNSFVDYNK